MRHSDSIDSTRGGIIDECVHDRCFATVHNRKAATGVSSTKTDRQAVHQNLPLLTFYLLKTLKIKTVSDRQCHVKQEGKG